jgi:hypothetical protein
MDAVIEMLPGFVGVRLRKSQKRVDFILTKSPDAGLALAKDFLDLRRGAIAKSDPDHLGGKSEKETPLMKIRVFRYDDEAVIAGKFPHYGVIRLAQTDEPHVSGTGVGGLQSSHQPRR